MSPRYPIKLLCRSLLSLLSVICTITYSSPALDPQVMRKTMQARYGSQGVARLTMWFELMRTTAGLSEVEQVRQVNDFFNLHIRHRDDIDLWQRSDYWATPLETLGVQAADCEDYSVAKYITLLQLGIPVERLRLIYVRARIGGGDSSIFKTHMVLGYYPSTLAMPLVLDNLTASIQPAEERTDLRPLFSFNSNYFSLRQSQSSHGGATTYLSPWRNLLNRIQREGLRW